MSEAALATTCRAGALSQLCGVNKQTLRRYHRLGLLQPFAIRQYGQRMYTRDDLIQLERLTLMQMLGLSRSEIRECLRRETDLPSELHLQRQILEEKRRRLNHLIYWMEYAEQVNRNIDAEDWCYLGSVVEAIRHASDPRYFKQRYVCRASGPDDNQLGESPSDADKESPNMATEPCSALQEK
jgi:DNA-binding transcriptional MerR regulator